jgi:hypothetical protein
LSLLEAGVHRGQNVVEHALEESGGKGQQALGEGLLADGDPTAPEEALGVEEPDQLADTADLAPDHGQDEGDHHRESEQALSQAQLAEVIELSQGRRMDQVGEALDHLQIGRSGDGSLGAIALDGPGVAHRAALAGRFVGGVVVCHAWRLPPSASAPNLTVPAWA